MVCFLCVFSNVVGALVIEMLRLLTCQGDPKTADASSHPETIVKSKDIYLKLAVVW